MDTSSEMVATDTLGGALRRFSLLPEGRCALHAMFATARTTRRTPGIFLRSVARRGSASRLNPRHRSKQTEPE
jgi:hypothetical protein